jgi:Flp pilus assembly pilin Flp
MTALSYGLIAALISIGLIFIMHLGVWIFA